MSSLMPTRLLPWPRPVSSSGATWCTCERSNFGSTVSAKSIFRVLAGGSRRCGLFAASTSPEAASATIHDFPVSPPGRAGAPASGATWTPVRPRRSPPIAGGGGSSAGAAAAAAGAAQSEAAAASAANRCGR